jgi:hypothetical protein
MPDCCAFLVQRRRAAGCSASQVRDSLKEETLGWIRGYSNVMRLWIADKKNVMPCDGSKRAEFLVKYSQCI